MNSKQITALKKAGYDLDFIERIQPQGGIRFDERYVKGGDGYYACLHVYRFPRNVPPFWMTNLTENINTITMMDISTANKEEVISAVNRTLSEFSDRMESERKYTDRNDALDEFKQLSQFASEITQGGEIIKLMHVRIFLSEDTLEALENEISDLRKKLNSMDYKATTFLFEQKSEWMSLFTSYGDQQKGINSRKGISIPSQAVGGGYPFNHQYLLDPWGGHIGTTDTNGAFVFDPYRVTEDRTSFSGMVLGMPGFGKSTFLKMLEDMLVGRQTIIRGIEKNRDWYNLIEGQEGVILDLAGTDGMINPLEVFATKTDKSGMYIDELGSFMMHKSKFVSQVRFINPEMTSIEALELGNLLENFYIERKLLEPGYMNNRASIKITGLKPSEYPTMNEFSSFLDAELKSAKYEFATVSKKEGLERIQTVIHSMTKEYGALFNGHTTLENFEDEQILFFDIDGISSFDKEIFNCQLFTALTIIWNQAMKNGRRMKNLLSEKKIAPEDVTYFMFFMDECQNIINAHNIFAVDYVVNFQKEMRKFSAGVYFATQSPQEILPEGTSSSDISKIKQVFELCHSKFYLNLDESVMVRMKEVLGSSLTESEYESLTRLKKGQVFCTLGGKNKYTVNVDPTEDQLERFAGGH
ncbi:ATPase [Carnobacterium divergens]|uniref:ATPase n=1 Tax=Carnobacterium divergens TaxID=2748 RepID=A0AAW8RFF3_CARDV|nr:ATPase [Carnobacterium divergens]MDT1958975.1 ATPase [Carnobacterium divergens]MDT1974943.1 ATPase [Carnobacterium divergens]MDT2012907.1 ATPase [Carnobacterium divergens]TFI60545.1 ATPase [Carnobacterium divergens]TFI61655.1 ATPase [Carnobacterium divergens]